MKIEYFNSRYGALSEASNALISLTAQMRELRRGGSFNLAVSGGDTAKSLFMLWKVEYADSIDWRHVNFFWVDERCVPPDDAESNFKYADEYFLHPLGISPSNIFRMRGEDDPEAEAKRYSKLIEARVGKVGEIPSFDCAILGVGGDMHTASIFPDDDKLMKSEALCEAAQKPGTRQLRVSMTAKLILNSKCLLAPVVGHSKVHVIRALENGEHTDTPASQILNAAENAIVFTDCPKT